jgi:transporter family protein
MIQFWVYIALLSMLISAITVISLKFIDTSNYDNNLFILLSFIMAGFLSILYLFLNKKNEIIKSCDKKLLVFVFLFGALLLCNNLCMQYSMKVTPNIGFSHLIVNLNVILTLFASYFLFKQKISFKSFIGIIITLFGISIVVNSN